MVLMWNTSDESGATIYSTFQIKWEKKKHTHTQTNCKLCCFSQTEREISRINRDVCKHVTVCYWISGECGEKPETDIEEGWLQKEFGCVSEEGRERERKLIHRKCDGSQTTTASHSAGPTIQYYLTAQRRT